MIIRPAIFPDDTDKVLDIWRAFIAQSPVNLDYQGNDAEFANLPGNIGRRKDACSWRSGAAPSKAASPSAGSARRYAR
jgi:hypothetical protein